MTFTSVAQRLAVERSLPILNDNSLSKTSKQCLKLEKVTVLPHLLDSLTNQIFRMPVMFFFQSLNSSHLAVVTFGLTAITLNKGLPKLLYHDTLYWNTHFKPRKMLRDVVLTALFVSNHLI